LKHNYIAEMLIDTPETEPQEMERLNERLRVLQERLREQPNSPAVMNVCNILIMQGKASDALSKLRSSADMYKNTYKYHLVLARAFKAVGDREKARQNYEKACQLAPQNEVAFHELISLAALETEIPSVSDVATSIPIESKFNLDYNRLASALGKAEPEKPTPTVAQEMPVVSEPIATPEKTISEKTETEKVTLPNEQEDFSLPINEPVITEPKPTPKPVAVPPVSSAASPEFKIDKTKLASTLSGLHGAKTDELKAEISNAETSNAETVKPAPPIVPSVQDRIKELFEEEERAETITPVAASEKKDAAPLVSGDDDFLSLMNQIMGGATATAMPSQPVEESPVKNTPVENPDLLFSDDEPMDKPMAQTLAQPLVQPGAPPVPKSQDAINPNDALFSDDIASAQADDLFSDDTPSVSKPMTKPVTSKSVPTSPVAKSGEFQIEAGMAFDAETIAKMMAEQSGASPTASAASPNKISAKHLLDAELPQSDADLDALAAAMLGLGAAEVPIEQPSATHTASETDIERLAKELASLNAQPATRPPVQSTVPPPVPLPVPSPLPEAKIEPKTESLKPSSPATPMTMGSDGKPVISLDKTKITEALSGFYAARGIATLESAATPSAPPSFEEEVMRMQLDEKNEGTIADINTESKPTKPTIQSADDLFSDDDFDLDKLAREAMGIPEPTLVPSPQTSSPQISSPQSSDAQSSEMPVMLDAERIAKAVNSVRQGVGKAPVAPPSELPKTFEEELMEQLKRDGAVADVKESQDITYDGYDLEAIAAQLAQAKMPKMIETNDPTPVSEQRQAFSDDEIIKTPTRQLAKLFEQQGAYAKAIQVYESLMEREPHNASMYNILISGLAEKVGKK
jgi:tetratricopeptide (TPR) repeat protein